MPLLTQLKPGFNVQTYGFPTFKTLVESEPGRFETSVMHGGSNARVRLVGGGAEAGAALAEGGGEEGGRAAEFEHRPLASLASSLGGEGGAESTGWAASKWNDAQIERIHREHDAGGLDSPEKIEAFLPVVSGMADQNGVQGGLVSLERLHKYIWVRNRVLARDSWAPQDAEKLPQDVVTLLTRAVQVSFFLSLSFSLNVPCLFPLQYPSTLNPQPPTLKLQLSTLNPQPAPLNPEQQATDKWGDGGWVNIGMVMPLLTQLKPDFDVSSYGFPTFKTLVESEPGLFELGSTHGGSSVRVRLVGGGAEAGAALAEGGAEEGGRSAELEHRPLASLGDLRGGRGGGAEEGGGVGGEGLKLRFNDEQLEMAGSLCMEGGLDSTEQRRAWLPGLRVLADGGRQDRPWDLDGGLDLECLTKFVLTHREEREKVSIDEWGGVESTDLAADGGWGGGSDPRKWSDAQLERIRSECDVGGLDSTEQRKVWLLTRMGRVADADGVPVNHIP